MKILYKYALILSIFLFIAKSVFPASISGFITDHSKGEPLAFTNIVLKGSNFGAASSVNGYFVIPDISPGQYTLKAMMMGYENYEQEIQLSANEDIRLDISLKVQAVQGDVVTVTAERTRFENKIDVSRINLNLREIKAAPAFIESDVFRSLQLLPGVSSQNDFSSALIVRGGSPDENLILLDGAEIYNPYHIGGIFSTFNADAIANAEFYAGGFTAEYGGRLSSVLEITTREGDSKNGRFFKNTSIGNYFDISNIKGEVNILSSKILLEGPIAKGSWLLSARRTYFDKLAQIYYWAKDEPQNWQYYFADLQLKITQKINTKNHFTFSSFGGNDLLAFTLSPNEINEIGFDWNWGNRTNSLNWRYIPNSLLFSELSLSATDYQFDVDLSFAQLDSAGNKSETSILINNTVSDINIEESITLFLSKKHQVKTGINLKFISMKFNYHMNDLDLFNINRSPYIADAYIQDQWKVSVLLSIQAGLRLSKYELHDKVYVQPRFGLKYNINENSKLKLSLGKYDQFLFTTNDDNEILRVVDFWEPVPPNLDAQSSLHMIAGIEQWLSEGFTLSFETYYKPYLNVLDANPGNNPADDTDDFIQGTGKAYGVEILLKKQTGRFTGWLGYAYARVRKEMDLNQDGVVSEADDEKYYLKYDTPNRINIVLNYQLNKKNSFSLSANYQNGQRYTPIVGKVFNRNGFTDMLYPYNQLSTIDGNINSATYPDYLRVDAGWVRNVSPFGIKGKLKLQIINISNHFNVLMYNWQHGYSPSRVTAVGMFPVIPSFGLEFEL